HAVYRIAFLVLLAVLAAIVANVLQSALVPSGTPDVPAQIPLWLFLLRLLSAVLLGYGLIYVVYRLRRDWNRLVFFRDDKVLLNTSVGRAISWLRIKFRKKERYETNPMRLPDALKQSLRESRHLGGERVEKVLAHYKGAPERSSISAVFEINSLVGID